MKNELQTEKLTIRKFKKYTVRHGRQVRVSEDTYKKIKKIADDSGRTIGEVSEMIMDWAVKNVVVIND